MTDTGEVSGELETTVPTDLTLSSLSDHEAERKPSRYSRMSQSYSDIHEKKQLELEMRRKNALITNLRSEMDVKTRTLHERFKDSEHQRELTQTKLKMQAKLMEDNSNRRVEMLENELGVCMTNIQDMQESAEKAKQALDDMTFSERDYHRLKCKPAGSHSLADYVLLKAYDHTYQLKKENEDLKSKMQPLSERLLTLETQIIFFKQDQFGIREENNKLRERAKELDSELCVVKSCVEHGNFASENFIRVKKERDILMKEIVGMKKSVEDLKIEMVQRLQEKESCQIDLERTKHNYETLSKECVVMGKHLNEVTEKWGECQDEASRLKTQLEKEQISKEELLQRMIHIRDKVKFENEERMLNEIERAKISTAQQYENEIRALKEVKNLALREKESALTASLEIRKKYEELYDKYLQNTTEESRKLVKQEKTYEELKAEHQKVIKNLKLLEVSHREKCLECDKVLTKLQLVEQELELVRKSSNERIRTLETEVGTGRARLEMIEKMEQELSDAIDEAAEGENFTELMLEALGGQVELPTKARHCFVKCVHLSRRVLQLERLLRTSEEKLRTEDLKCKKLKNEIDNLNNYLQQVDEPYSYLIVRLREHELTVENLTFEAEQLSKTLGSTEKHNRSLQKENDSLTKDLEKLYRNREEINVVKEQLGLLLKEVQEAPSVDPVVQSKEKKNPKHKWK